MISSANQTLRLGEMYVDLGNRPAFSIRYSVVRPTGTISKTCFSVEPGIYLPEFGIRSEVNILVLDGRAQVSGEQQNELLKKTVNGWQIAGITRFASGTPLNIGSNGNLGTLGGAPRADYIGPVYPQKYVAVEKR